MQKPLLLLCSLAILASCELFTAINPEIGYTDTRHGSVDVDVDNQHYVIYERNVNLDYDDNPAPARYFVVVDGHKVFCSGDPDDCKEKIRRHLREKMDDY